MFKLSEKAMRINQFKSASIPKPRDIFARYGERKNPQAVTGSEFPVCMSSAVIAQMTAGQNLTSEGIKKKRLSLGNGEDLPPSDMW